MKQTFFRPAITGFSFCAVLFFVSCGNFSSSDNEAIITQTRSVQPFTELTIKGIFPVVISQTGADEFVKVEADESAQAHLIVKNAGNELVIEMDESAPLLKSKKIKVFVNIKKLHLLNYQSVGALSTQGQLKVDSLELNSESVGKMDIDVDAHFLRVNLNSVGATTLKGRANEVRINNKSVGTLSAYDLKAQTLMIHNTAVGRVQVYADSAFYIRSSAIGNLYYKGPAQVIELNSEGIGKVTKAE